MRTKVQIIFAVRTYIHTYITLTHIYIHTCVCMQVFDDDEDQSIDDFRQAAIEFISEGAKAGGCLVSVYVCVYIHIYMYVCVYIYIYMCICR